MARHIESKKGLRELLKRMENEKGTSKIPDYENWIKVIEGCIEENLAMDEVDYENFPPQLRKLWRGLK
jgi:hypothetical protein